MSTLEATTKTDADGPAALRVIEDATCTFCGCVCDDIDISVDTQTNHIVEAKRACVLGKAWFFNPFAWPLVFCIGVAFAAVGNIGERLRPARMVLVPLAILYLLLAGAVALSWQFAALSRLVPDWVGRTPVELIGGQRFPPITREEYLFTLGPHSLLWLRLDHA